MNSGTVNFPISYQRIYAPIVVITGCVGDTYTQAVYYIAVNKITRSSFNLLSSSDNISYSKFVISIGW